MKYTKLLEPGYIGKVRTRNRIYKTGAGMMTFHQDELSMNENSLGYYDALARGGAGVVSMCIAGGQGAAAVFERV